MTEHAHRYMNGNFLRIDMSLFHSHCSNSLYNNSPVEVILLQSITDIIPLSISQCLC